MYFLVQKLYWAAWGNGIAATGGKQTTEFEGGSSTSSSSSNNDNKILQ
jgi:hypothetical protein